MKSKLTVAQQVERFGMRQAEAHLTRDLALGALSPQTIAAARREWQDLAYRLRGSKGQPFQCRQHPEAVRVRMLANLVAGMGVRDASDEAYKFAEMPE